MARVKFLQLKDGRPALDIRDVLDEELKVLVVGGIQTALKSDNAVVFRGIREHKVTIRRVRSATASGYHLLISFEHEGAGPASTRMETEVDARQVSRDQIGQLENELAVTKENLQAAIEELETSNEELQAANEELLASNEELQSTNEELQSVNEELYTVNAEYQRKITELTELTNDMDNLLSSTDVGTIFLDKQLRIRRFTPQIAEAFNLLPLDIGRPLATFANNIEHPNLSGSLSSVLATGAPVEEEVKDRAGHAFLLRILPYRAKGTVDGVVVTMIDVQQAQARARRAPRSGRPARSIPRDALARAAKSARCDRHRDVAPRRFSGREGRRETAHYDLAAGNRRKWRASSKTCSRRAASPRTRSSFGRTSSTSARSRARPPMRCARS